MSKQQEPEAFGSSGGALTKEEILERLKAPKNRRIFFTPMINTDQQVGPTAIDIRLGTQFILFKRTKYPVVDVCDSEPEEMDWKIGTYHEKVSVALGESLVLHPQQLVLGCTLEYVRLPNDLAAEVIGRSSWGRLGLIISAATLVHPGYAGVITLELANEGDTPIALYPGIRIAQLVFTKLIGCDTKEHKLCVGKYAGSVEPSFSKLHEDKDIRIIRRIRSLTE
jgi:dCTP deaminase